MLHSFGYEIKILHLGAQLFAKRKKKAEDWIVDEQPGNMRDHPPVVSKEPAKPFHSQSFAPSVLPQPGLEAVTEQGKRIDKQGYKLNEVSVSTKKSIALFSGIQFAPLNLLFVTLIYKAKTVKIFWESTLSEDM